MPALVCAIAAHLVFAAASVQLVRVDLAERRLPNRVLLWAGAAILSLFLASTVLAALDGNETAGSSRLFVSLIAAASYGIVAFCAWWVAPTAVGAGDVKLAPVIGLMAGWAGPWTAGLWVPIFICALGAVVGLVQRARRRADFAFGPVMIAAAWIGIALAGVGWIG